MTLEIPTDSYISVEDANAYHELRASFDEWNELDEQTKARRLVNASDFLDHNYTFTGEKADITQIRQFPRKPSEDIPINIKHAVCELALQAELNQNAPQKMSSVSVGPVSVNYDDSATITSPQNRFEYVKAILGDLLVKKSSFGVVNLKRG